MAAQGGEFLFETQRSRVIRMYKDAEMPFQATTRPYKSTRPVVFELAQTQGTGATAVGYYVARASQLNKLVWFNYAVGDNISDGFGNNYEATDDDTNQGEANNTDGSEDFVIEGFSSSARSKRLIFLTGAGTPPALFTDPDLIAAYGGIDAVNASSIPPAIYDPGALTSSPQFDSPFNLEEGLYRAVAPHLAIKIEFDRGKRTEYIGTLDQFPEGGGKSYLKANGEPSTNNRWRSPEGFLWRRQGQPDSLMNLIAQLQRPVVIPMNSIPFPGLGGETQAYALPTKMAIDITIRAHGLAVDAVSNN